MVEGESRSAGLERVKALSGTCWPEEEWNVNILE